MYVLAVKTGFCDFFVQYVDAASQHVRMTTLLCQAARFRSVREAKAHAKAGEVARWIG